MDASLDPTYPLFPVCAFCGFFLVLVLLPWYLRKLNVGVCAYIVWTSVACLIEFINSLVWSDNVSNPVPVWCDISSKILLGAGVGIPAAGLSITRKLYYASASNSANIPPEVAKRLKRRAIVIDSCIAFGIPMIVMALHYVVQAYRFDILEGVGCYPVIYNTLLAYFLVFMWPVLLGCISFVLSAFTLCIVYDNRRQLLRLLSTNRSFSTSHYVRMATLAISEILCTIPIGTYSMYVAVKNLPLQPWTSWADTHYDFSYVGQVPAVEWMSDPNYRLSVELTRWLFPASALFFFLLFGFSLEAREYYHAVFLRVVKIFGYNPPSAPEISIHTSRRSNGKETVSSASLPLYVPSPSAKNKRKESFMSFIQKCPDIDVERTASCSSKSSDSYSPQDLQTSSAATGAGDDTNESENAVTTSPSMTDRSTVPCTIPAYHLPFRPPSLAQHPTPQEPRSSGNFPTTVQTPHSVTN